MKGYIETSNPLYQAWIDTNVPDKCRQLCLPKADAMAEAFPELRVVGQSGFISSHAWCVTMDNKVVDPTAHQFDKKYLYSDIRLERDDFPIGRCSYCGETRWPNTPGARKYLEQIGDEEQVGIHTSCIKRMENEF